jgi:hypothetical protein
MASVMRNCDVYSTKVTHSGRHAGTAEAYKLGLNLDHIRHLGRWVMGQMENFYAPKNPIIGAFYMAHFNKKEEPYLIERDLVSPPKELQRLIFPWIEESFNDLPDFAPEWKKLCVKEMDGVDPDKATEDDVFWGKFGATIEPGQDNALNSSALIDRIQFLKLLVRMRRVILQDAVMLLNTRKQDKVLTNPVISALSRIFECQMFKDFSFELLLKIEDRRRCAIVIDGETPLNYKSLKNSINNVALQTSVISADIAELKRNTPTRTELRQVMLEVKSHLFQRDQAAHEAAWKISERNRLEQMYQQQQFEAQRLAQEGQRLVQESQRQAQEAQRTHQMLLSVSSESNNNDPRPSLTLPTSPVHDNFDGSIPLDDSVSLFHESSYSLALESTHEQNATSSSDMEIKGYRMKPDPKGGALSVREAWDEYHGAVADALRSNPKWPYTSKRRQYLNRRRRFINLVIQIAREENKNINEYVDFLSAGEYKGMTVNKIAEQLGRKDKGKGIAN